MDIATARVRRIEAADRQLFLNLADEFYHSSAVLHPIPAAYQIRNFEEMLRSDQYLLGYVIELAGQPAGYALLARTFSPEAGGVCVWLEELYLKEQFRGQGLGNFFFDWLEENLPAARYRLEVEPDNEGAARLYARRGYQKLGYVQMIKEPGNRR